MRSLFPFISENSFKYIRSVVKNFPNKIYSVEIKIKSENKQPEKLIQTSIQQQTNLNQKSTLPSDESSSVKQTFKELKINEKSTSNIPKQKASIHSDDIINSNDTNFPTSLSHTQIIEKTTQLVRSLNFASNLSQRPSLPSLISLNILLKEITNHLQSHPEASNIVIRENVMSKILKIREVTQNRILKKPNAYQINDFNYAHYSTLNENSRQVLSLLGYTDPPKGRGIRVLCIDGGGTRGILAIEILRQIERMCGKPIHQIFDLICGVSTGAIIAMLLGALRISIDECEAFYRQVSSYLFKTDIVRGTGRLLWSHAYYDTAVFEKILKEIYGETVMLHTRKHKDCPHIVAISAIVNLPSLQPYLFRNYELHSSSKPLSHFEGSSSHKIWEGVRASAAAPGYFEEFTIGKHVHQDGGILINNPTAVAIHEAKLLWPNEKIQCVISLGSGRYQPNNVPLESMPETATLSSLKHKILRLIDSATDTEMVHRLMQDLLPSDVYYRINPAIRDNSNIDENRPEKLEQMKIDAQMYLRKNEHKFNRAVQQLNLNRTLIQELQDKIKLKSKMYL